VRTDEILFSSCGTESDNSAIFSALETRPGKRHIVTTQVEHPAICTRWNTCRERHEVTFVGVRTDGVCEPKPLETLSGRTPHRKRNVGQNETGVIMPLRNRPRGKEKACSSIRRRDGSGKKSPSTSRHARDMLRYPAQVACAKGIGALYVRRGTPFKP
jgi:cysteine desulfurase